MFHLIDLRHVLCNLLLEFLLGDLVILGLVVEVAHRSSCSRSCLAERIAHEHGTQVELALVVRLLVLGLPHVLQLVLLELTVLLPHHLVSQ